MSNTSPQIINCNTKYTKPSTLSRTVHLQFQTWSSINLFLWTWVRTTLILLHYIQIILFFSQGIQNVSHFLTDTQNYSQYFKILWGNKFYWFKNSNIYSIRNHSTNSVLEKRLLPLKSGSTKKLDVKKFSYMWNNHCQ